MGFYRTFRTPHDLSRFLAAQTVIGPEDHRSPLAFGQTMKSVSYTLFPFFLDQSIEGVAVAAERRFIDIEHLASALLQMIQAGVQRDLIEPGFERRITPKSAEPLHRLEKGLLGQVFRFFHIPGHAVQERVQLFLVTHDQFFCSVLFTSQVALNQGDIIRHLPIMTEKKEKGLTDKAGRKEKRGDMGKQPN